MNEIGALQANGRLTFHFTDIFLTDMSWKTGHFDDGLFQPRSSLWSSSSIPRQKEVKAGPRRWPTTCFKNTKDCERVSRLKLQLFKAQTAGVERHGRRRFPEEPLWRVLIPHHHITHTQYATRNAHTHILHAHTTHTHIPFMNICLPSFFL